MMCGPSGRPEEDSKATCQFCFAEFERLEDLVEHLKRCETRKKSVLKIKNNSN